MSTLRGRIGLSLLVFGLATLLVVGGSLWIALRDLHREAALGSLSELTAPYAGVVRARLPGSFLGPAPDRRAGGFIQRVRDAQRRGDEDESVLASFLEELREGDDVGISVILVEDDASFIVNPAEGTADALATVPTIDPASRRGQVVTGTTTVDGTGEVLYAATPLRDPLRASSAPYLMLAQVDDSAELATADVVRALTLAGLVLLLIGIPLAVGLSRSVTRPLRRLSAATETVAAGRVPEPLPTAGPEEVADASAAFNAMAAEVGATRDAQQQLLADIRHDLRTPLTVIGGFSQALRDGTASGASAVRAADAIFDETERLERMLSDLDHLTVPGVAGPPLHLETVDGRDVAAAAVERFAGEAERRQQVLEVSEQATSELLTADRDALDRILGNIIANAMTHAPTPGGHIVLEVFRLRAGEMFTGLPRRPDGDAIVLAVRDDGAGIPADAMPHVFDRFYRADPSRTSRGSGLGLAIVRDLAEASGGRAFAENLPRGGARVGVVLPLMTEPGTS